MIHIILPLSFVLTGLNGASDTPMQASLGEPRSAMLELNPNLFAGSGCRDANLPAGDNLDQQPRFDRGPATPGSGQIIYAVDHRVNGCSVIVVKSTRIAPSQGMRLSPQQMFRFKDGRAAPR